MADVLRQFQHSGLPIIFSDDMVPLTLRIKSEPKATRPREIAIEILVPHGLTLSDGPHGRLLVVRLPNAVDRLPERRPQVVCSCRRVSRRGGRTIA